VPGRYRKGSTRCSWAISRLRGRRFDLAAALHESVPDAPILLATGSADEIDVDALVAAGISEVVHRPLVSSELAWAWRAA